jgi:medium-chain acyl-[acyl-carrier-protein] hydrolase
VPSIPVLVEGLLPALRPHLDLPFAFFGHSMGAVLAREVAGGLARHGGPQPHHLFVSGRRPPWMRDEQTLMHRLSDREFVDEITRRYGGIPPEVLEHPDLMELLLPCLRADIEALETFEPVPSAPLVCPVTAYGGIDDRLAPRAHLDAWRIETTGGFDVRVFAGDHFYLEPQRAELLADLSHRLAPVLREAVASEATA